MRKTNLIKDMKNALYYLCLLLFLSISTFVWSDTVPIEGDWTQGDLRSLSSIPFTVEQEENTLFIYSDKAIDNVYIRIVSVEGVTYNENVYSFSTNETISISLDGLSEGDCLIEISHRNGYLSGEFVNP